MKAVGVSMATLLVGVQALDNIHCNFAHPINGTISDVASKLRDAVKGPIEKFCLTGFPGLEEIVSIEVEDTTFQIVQDNEDAEPSLEDCTAAFDSIITQCVDKNNVWGGELAVDGLVFDVHHTELTKRDFDNIGLFPDEDENELFDFEYFGELNERSELRDREHVDLKVRAKKPSKPNPAPPKPAKPKPAPQQPTKPQPSPQQRKPPGTTPKPSPQKPDPAGPKSSKTPSSKVSSSVKSVPSKSCDQLHRDITREFSGRRGNEARDDITHVGGMSQIAKRAQKKALGCGVNIFANNYPDHPQMPRTARVYGFTSPSQCSNIDFRNSGTKKARNTDYDVEHVLDWVVFTRFWDWFDRKQFKGRRYSNPNPTKLLSNGRRATVSFCQKWQKQWLNIQPFSIRGGPTLTPMQHVAAKYPSANDFTNEFVWLQRNINQGPKEEMWASKDTNRIYDDTKMRSKIMGTDINNARDAVIRLKLLLGAHKYMNSPQIQSVLGQQRNRIGRILGELDREMPNHRGIERGQQLDAWQPMQLKQMWERYTNEKFDAARTRTRYTMDTWINRVQARWMNNPPQGQGTAAHQELKTAIRKVANAWRVERMSWNRPANWGS